ncbi:MAG TPA: cyclic nucleotide-binding domain-containing protein [Polyangiaceae bacterium]
MSSDPGKTRVEHELFLRAFLSTKPPDRVAKELSQVTRDTHLDRGAVLFEAGQQPERLHFVANGRIQLTGVDGSASTADAGSLLGMIDASIPRVRPWTATALEPTHVLTLDFADYLDILEDNFGFAVDTLRSGAESYCVLSERLGAAGPLESPAQPAPALRGSELDVVERILVLQHVGLFGGAPAQALVRLAHSAEAKRWRPGDTLFAVGDPITGVRIVANGLVVTRRRDDTVVTEFGSHQVVGDLEVLGKPSHEACARAEAASITLEIQLEDLFDVAEDHFDLWRSMQSYVARQRARLSESMPDRASDLGRMTL